MVRLCTVTNSKTGEVRYNILTYANNILNYLKYRQRFSLELDPREISSLVCTRVFPHAKRACSSRFTYEPSVRTLL